MDGDRIVLTYTELKPDAEGLRAQLDRDLDRIEKHLEWVKNDVKQFNESLSEIARTRIDTRRERLLADRGIAASLGFNIRERDSAPRTYAVPTSRRKPPIERPRPRDGESFRPEPELVMKEYEHILDILSNMVMVMERSPEAFRRMKEEHVRDHFLVQLNAQYEGQATGETFNFEGKTDILVRVDGRNVFIAECKFWRGPKTLIDTVIRSSGTQRGETRRWRSCSSTELRTYRVYSQEFPRPWRRIPPSSAPFPSIVRQGSDTSSLTVTIQTAK